MFPAYDDGVWVLSLSQFGNCYSPVKLYILTTPIYGAKKQKAKVGRYKAVERDAVKRESDVLQALKVNHSHTISVKHHLIMF